MDKQVRYTMNIMSAANSRNVGDFAVFMNVALLHSCSWVVSYIDLFIMLMGGIVSVIQPRSSAQLWCLCEICLILWGNDSWFDRKTRASKNCRHRKGINTNHDLLFLENDPMNTYATNSMVSWHYDTIHLKWHVASEHSFHIVGLYLSSCSMCGIVAVCSGHESYLQIHYW